MTSIYDIPYEDLKIFLLANNRNVKNEDDAYDIASDLLNDKKSIGHTTSIIEWIMAHNLIINNIKIPYYSIIEIDNMSRVEISQLARSLKMKGNNHNNIKNILRYLHKLQDDKEFLLPELNNIILNNLITLEIEDINVSSLGYNDVIDLLTTHRNKKEIRKFISDNLEKIIIYNSLNINFVNGDLDDLLDRVTIFNKNTMIQIIIDNKKFYDNKAINDAIKEAKENNDDQNGEVYIGKYEMNYLIIFTFDLIKLNEIGLAKKVFDISNKLHYFGTNYSYNYELVDRSIDGEAKVLEIIINFMGENEYIKKCSLVLAESYFSSSICYKFLENLVKLEKYDLLVDFLQICIDQNLYNAKSVNKVLENIKEAIRSKDDELILKYINFI